MLEHEITTSRNRCFERTDTMNLSHDVECETDFIKLITVTSKNIVVLHLLLLHRMLWVYGLALSESYGTNKACSFQYCRNDVVHRFFSLNHSLANINLISMTSVFTH
ncbi:hypothetical protein BD560DRAFT_428649 [Blakeslea trispora]|nr:hypothetical protein BD560DRAFT_428649 [Blakeslea trispora]